jgi:hypothetical protein
MSVSRRDKLRSEEIRKEQGTRCVVKGTQCYHVELRTLVAD